jgi:hypothetical protein
MDILNSLPAYYIVYTVEYVLLKKKLISMGLSEFPLTNGTFRIFVLELRNTFYIY